MCLAIVAHRVFPRWPVFLAANRDEYYDRPSTPPATFEIADVTVLAPRDERAGGTWIGVNDRGIVAVITNRTDLPDSAPADAPSRGLLVRDVLGSGDLPSALELLRERASGPSAPFNLVVGDSSEFVLAERTDTSMRFEELPPGVHFVANGGAMNDDGVGEVRRARKLWRSHDRDRRDAALDVLGCDTEEDGLPAICKRHADRGTVSSTMIGIEDSGRVHFMHADGEPGSTAYQVYELGGGIHE